MPAGGLELGALLLSPWALALLGLLIGSFLNVVVHRLPMVLWREWWEDSVDFQLADAKAWQPLFGMGATPPAQLADAARVVRAELGRLPALGLIKPGSRCPSCGHPVRWYENIPLLSWLALRGRCSACRTPISWRYPAVEAGVAGLFAACALAFGASAATVVYCIACALLVTMALIDFDTTLLPDGLTLPLVALGLVASLAGWTPVTPGAAAAGVVAGYAVLWGVGLLWRVARGMRNAMMEGDMKMLAGIGALLGWQALPSALLLAAALGAVVGLLTVALRGGSGATQLPFGPWLAVGGLVSIFFGSPLREWWGL